MSKQDFETGYKEACADLGDMNKEQVVTLLHEVTEERVDIENFPLGIAWTPEKKQANLDYFDGLIAGYSSIDL
jgi:hypothetical protein